MSALRTDLPRWLREPILALAATALALGAGAALVGVLGGGGGAASGSPDAFADVPGVSQRVLAQRFCARGEATTGDVPEPAQNDARAVVRAESGAYVAAVRRALDEAPPAAEPGRGAVPLVGSLHPLNLIRAARPELPGWRSRTYAAPEQVGFELEGTVNVDRVAFWHVPVFAEASWARDVVLYLSTMGPDRGFYKLRGWRLEATTGPQLFTLPFPTPARYARLCILSTHGAAGYVSLGGVAFGVLTGTAADTLPPGPPIL